jgi:hypothetical protein
MNKIIVIIILTITCFRVKAQTTQIPIDTPRIQQRVFTDKILYNLPKCVADSLIKVVDLTDSVREDHYIVFSHIIDDEWEITYFKCNKSTIEDALDFFFKISNRELILGDKKIPIILTSDYVFGEVGFYISHSTCSIKFKLITDTSDSGCGIEEIILNDGF